jgi:hypothetical protein
LLAAVLHERLYKKGILKTETIPKLWAEHGQRLRLQLLGLMAQVGKGVLAYLFLGGGGLSRASCTPTTASHTLPFQATGVVPWD